ncbi:MAG TPA: hypothetical protein VES40_19840, partial [Ilumatobacteraceae bacterium]|nr:hypothetical protein [Ilumatobacteraceae bacterium]
TERASDRIAVKVQCTAWAVVRRLLGLASSDYAPRYVRACRLLVVPGDLVTHCSQRLTPHHAWTIVMQMGSPGESERHRVFVPQALGSDEFLRVTWHE